MKVRAIVLIFLAIFAAFTTFVAVGSYSQITEENNDFASSYGTVEVHDEFVQPSGIPIDCPGGPTPK